MFVGIFGGGQLGRMLALAGYSLGVRSRVLDPAPDASAGQVTHQIIGPYNDPNALERFAEGLDVATYEFEHLPLQAVRFISKQTPFYPPVSALEVIQDRLMQKIFLRSLGIPTARFVEINTRPDLEEAAAQVGLPAVLKTRYSGYDGKGQCTLHKPEELDLAWNTLGKRPLVLEALIPFQRELSLIAVSDRGGHVLFYPLVENHHRHHILQWSIAPAPDCTGQQQLEAEQVVLKIVHALRYVGVLTVEFFQHEGRLIVNELAPRVHNSGHWTIEGAETSQFENHLRAILGLPVGATAMRGCAAMFNLIGNLEHAGEWLTVPGAHLHLYGKAARPGRKLGHVTVRADDPDTLRARLKQLRHAPIFL
jgi:5-(carboxyamino)imidazole ribonucleotide synthase